MKIFIAEGDMNIIMELRKIIEDNMIAEIVGHAQNGVDAVKQIESLHPDIVILDLMIPQRYGISIVRDIKRKYPKVQFIMISEVHSKHMTAKAYEEGVEYYVNKPINAIEIENVIKRVKHKIELRMAFEQIQKIVNFSKCDIEHHIKSNIDRSLEGVMKSMGVAGTVGSSDIIQIVKFLIDTGKNMSDYTLKELCHKFSDSPKSMEQRIRRTAALGMSNIANLGIENQESNAFAEYSNGIYSFQQVKKEMDFIRGKSKFRGKINCKKFIDGIIFYTTQ
ncbi:two-component system, response regulator YcbB [Peptoclostridium litorale DSM 5388]|uniref:Stage 0 sporulation protein A homolog n=1 Tax=Peptoclostridium litorale DSM 5388 TaxID=1121324 RepID=A0A069RI70_PEPLI|nr:DNA-binding domain-containing protein [Peptoclostridium litorale]KDR95845.1 transcriptional regulatory protein GlnL [Peptoclostridium litorale DSM 5388]SIO11486.1 two-component system, response regulator YcbB [Peptoclostridium litorale DSM 5388]